MGMYRPSDMEIALYFIRLLRAPCAVPGAEREEKELYIRQATRALLNLSNPFAARLLKKELDRVKALRSSHILSGSSGEKDE